jgi:hypothetical protein
MEKYLLFYSNYCNYSKTLLEEVSTKGLEDFFLTICVDTNIYKIPSFVDRLPMVYMKRTRKVFIEDGIIDLINDIFALKNKSSNNGGNDNSKEEIESYSKIEMNNSFSDNFSFLDDNSQKRSFVFIENDKYNDNAVMNNGNTPPTSLNDEGSSKLDSSAIEKYMLQRDNDFNSAMQKMQQK